MHAFRRTCSDGQEVVNQENNSVSVTSLDENNFGASAKDYEASSLAWRNINHRGAFLTFLVLDPDGNWKTVAMPFQCLDQRIHAGSRSRVKMDGLCSHFHLLVNSVMVDQVKAWRGTRTETSCSVKSFTDRTFSGSNLQYQSQSKALTNKVSRWNALPGKSAYQSPFSHNGSSLVIPAGSCVTNASDIHTDTSKVDKPLKRNSRKKARRKGKRDRKPSLDVGSTDVECIHASSTDETLSSKGTDHVIGPVTYATTLAVLSPDCSSNSSEGNNGGSVGYSEISKTYTTRIEEKDVLQANFIDRPPLYTTRVDEIDVLEANFIDQPPLCSSRSGVQTAIPDLSSLRTVQDSLSELFSCVNDPGSSVFTEESDSFILGSISDRSNDDESINAVYNVDICSSRGMAERYTQSRNIPRNSSVSCLGNSRMFHAHSGKKKNHSFWQKVCRNGTNECGSGLRKVNSVDSRNVISSKVASVEKNINDTQCTSSLTDVDKNRAKVRMSRRLKTSSGLKQEFNFLSRKESYVSKSASNLCMKTNTEQNGAVDSSPHSGGQKGLVCVSRSLTKVNFPRTGCQTRKIESITSGHFHRLEDRPNMLESFEHVYSTASSSLSDQTAKQESKLLLCHNDPRNQAGLLDGQSTVFLNTRGSEGFRMGKGFSAMEHDIMRRWIPVGTKDSELTGRDHSRRSQCADKLAVESCILEDTGREMASFEAFACPVNSGTKCSLRGSRGGNGQLFEEEFPIEKHRNQSTCSSRESCIDHAAEMDRDPKDRDNSAVDNELDMILQAVNDAYGAQLASEVVEKAIGRPVAEFERFLYSASPVISLPHNISHCQACSPDAVFVAPLCRHETPSLSLGSLWQWYEKHGIFGLEVKAEDDENSKTFGMDRASFRAYFVPFLSAVQLFRVHHSCPSDSSKGNATTESTEAFKLAENSSHIGECQIFSVLIPHPRTEDMRSMPSRINGCSETSEACRDCNAIVQVDDSRSSNDVELVYEYFEAEQPQQRRPLFDMIKDLVRGNEPSQCRAFGNPSELVSVALNDLHPKSWYSVAWYPIYRIPDGSFHTAFLTYHSLGHLVRGSASCDSFGGDACVVSPVVGLQTYNTQGECWLQPRQSAQNQTTEIPNLNPCEVLKERLRTLEHTASLMARAVVTKGSVTSVNRQPDYEFFLSRRRW